MYIRERPQQESYAYNSVQVVLDVYDDDGRSDPNPEMRRAFTQAALGALSQQVVKRYEAISLIGSFNTDGEIALDGFKSDALLRVVSDYKANDHQDLYIDAILDRASEGSITTTNLVEELEFNGSLGEIIVVDRNLMLSEVVDGKMQPWLGDVEGDVLDAIHQMSGNDSTEYRLAKENLDYVNDYGFHHLNEEGSTENQHMVLVNVDEQRNVTPFLTVLNDRYIANQYDQVEQSKSVSLNPSIAEN